VKVELLTPDVAPGSVPPRAAGAFDFAALLDDVGSVLARASDAENEYASGTGRLGEAIYERARADVVLSVATAAAQRSAQALNTILNMQI
jgi:hypothetical protein